MKITKYEEVWDIWIKSKDKLHNYVLSRFKNKELAEEATQEVVLKIYKSCCSDREISNLNSWLYQITHNVSLDILKRESKQQTLKPMGNDENDAESLSEISPFLEQLIQFLPEKYAVPLIMSDIEGIPQKEIAEKMELGLSATKSRIQRARQLLKQEISQCYELETNNKGGIINADIKPSCKPLNDLKKKK